MLNQKGSVMRFSVLAMVLSISGCSLFSAPQNNFPKVLSIKSDLAPESIYACVEHWLLHQDTIVLTAKHGRVYGWNADKNHVFSLHADGKKIQLYAAVMTNSMERKLKKMVSSCGEEATAVPPAPNFWSPYFQV